MKTTVLSPVFVRILKSPSSAQAEHKRGAHQGVQGIRTLLMGAALTVTLGGCGYLGTLTPKEETDFLPSSASAKTKPVEAAPLMFGMNGPLGINSKAYLTEEVRTSLARLGELHQALNTMQNDIRMVTPSVDRIDAMKLEIQELGQKFENMLTAISTDVPPPSFGTGQPTAMADSFNPAPQQNNTAQQRPMQILRAGDAVAAQPIVRQPAPSVAPYVAPTASMSEERKQFVSQIPAGKDGLIDIRIADHNGKSRLVLDVSAPVDIRYDLDAAENLLIVELPGQSANGLTAKTIANSSLVKGYDIQKSGDTTLVIFMFKKPTKIIETMQLKGAGKAAHRIVFDMAK